MNPYDHGARLTDPEESFLAAAAVNRPKREFQVALALFNLKEGTTEDIADWLSARYGRSEIPSNVSPRIKPMEDKGLIIRTTRTKVTRQGRQSKIFALTPKGEDFVRDTLFNLENPEEDL